MARVDLKVVLLGQHDVGKTCLVERYLNDKWKDDTTATVGAAFGAKKIMVGGKTLTMGIWDTAGAERYESMSRIYYRSARAAVVCYDITKQETFNKVRFWINELLANEADCSIYLVGTKGDLQAEKVVRDTLVSEYAKTVGAKIFLTSAKSGQGVQELFRAVAEEFVSAASTPFVSPKLETLDLDDGTPDYPTRPPAAGCSC